MRRRRPPSSPAISRPRRPSAIGVRPGPGAVAPIAALVVALLVVLGGPPLPVVAQEPDPEPIARVPAGEDGWNAPRALELAERARARRRQPITDEALRSYRADVTGHVYFFIDREDDPEPVLLRADQVALELYWMWPDRVKQVIVGMRSEEQFPIRDFRYYLDRYTVIQNGFDDVIRVGEGRDVRNVIHPLAAEGRIFYDFRLADSTAIRLPGQAEPLLVYEVQVRPRDFSLPGFVGSLYLERARADLVRLAFTFTPASYLDRRNERVEIMLENALWEGQHWLPREQRLLVRREIPEIDLDVGTVIRATLRVRDYELNPVLPETFFRGAEVVMAGGPERLARHAFDEGLYDGFAAVGLEDAVPGTLDAVDVEAITGRILRQRFLRGVPRTRLFAPATSDVVRFDRAEGLVTGVGAAFGVGRSQAYVYGGYAWGSGDPLARVGWRPAGPDPRPRLHAEAYLNRPRDLGLRSATSGVVASASAALLGRDYRDFVLTTGVTAERRWGSNRSRSAIGLTVERVEPADQAHDHAPFDDERRFRPVPVAAPGTEIAAAWRLDQRRRLGDVSVSLQPAVELGVVAPENEDGLRGFARLRAHGSGVWASPSRTVGAEGRATLGTAVGALEPHQHWYIGGPGTLPGHPFHAYTGSTAAVADITLWRTVVPGLLRLRALGAVGWTGGTFPPHPVNDPSLEPWHPRRTGTPRASLGLGIGLIHGLIRLDYAVRTDTGRGALILSVDPDLWSFL